MMAKYRKRLNYKGGLSNNIIRPSSRQSFIIVLYQEAIKWDSSAFFVRCLKLNNILPFFDFLMVLIGLGYLTTEWMAMQNCKPLQNDATTITKIIWKTALKMVFFSIFLKAKNFQASKTCSFLDLRSFALRDIMTAGPI